MKESHLPLGGLIDGPSPFDTLETWESHLTALNSWPRSILGDLEIDRAEKVIFEKRRDEAIANTIKRAEASAGRAASLASTPQPAHLIDKPGLFDTLETWESYLGELRSLPPSAERRAEIDRAEALITDKKTET